MRQVIKPTDIQEYFGKKSRMSFKMMSILRKHFGKTNQQPITVDEFCEYYKVNKESVIQVMILCDQNKKVKTQESNLHQKNLENTKTEEELKEQKPQSKPKYEPYQFSKRTW
jgi:mRNA deadenylase 3'-5' endonuclease subunit Ccr4